MFPPAISWGAAVLGWLVAFVLHRRRAARRFRWTAAVLGVLLTALALVPHCPIQPISAAPDDPIEFARTTYLRLSQGNPSVESAIDFDHLDAGGVSIGATYSLIPDEAQKASYRREFIANYAKMFRQTNASIESLTNWRLDSADAYEETVAADIPGGHTALVVLSRTTPHKAVGFNMR